MLQPRFIPRGLAAVALASFMLLAACGSSGVGTTPQPSQPGSTLAPTAGLLAPTASPATVAPGGEEPAPLPVTSATATTTSPAGDFPDSTTVTWAPFVAGLDRPIGVYNAGDGSGRLFVLEQKGTIRLVRSGGLLSAPFLDIQDRVGSQGSEQGLLGLAFDPHYTQNGFFYVNYTDLSGNTVIARFSVTKQNPDQADPGSQSVLLQVQQPFPNHNGGQLVFGPDGYLYIGLGDGGSGGDPFGNGESLGTLLGKILRIDVSQGSPYAIPPDNPFVKGGGKAEIWAYGLRNPWRFSFDRQTHDLYIADVGQNTWEEVDFLPAGSPGGANFGWSYREGRHPFKGSPPADLKLVEPVAEYSHAEGGCSITGGFVYRGSALPDWQGVYFYGDYCSGKIWGLHQAADGSWKTTLLFQTGGGIASFGEDEAGELYLADGQSAILKLQPR